MTVFGSDVAVFLLSWLKVEKSKIAINTVTVAIVIPKLFVPSGSLVLWGPVPAKVRPDTSIQSRQPTSLNRPAKLADKKHLPILPTQHTKATRLRLK